VSLAARHERWEDFACWRALLEYTVSNQQCEVVMTSQMRLVLHRVLISREKVPTHRLKRDPGGLAA
jgi:hypothetical protein